MFDLTGRRVWVAGKRGMVGRAIVRRLAGESCTIVSPETRVDLRDQAATFAWMAANLIDLIDLIFLAAAKVGGIAANNDRPGEFLYDNLMIETNVSEGARVNGVKKLVFLGSSWIFPKFAPQPMPENALLTGELEPTNQWYAIARIARLKMCEAYRKQYGCDFISAQPTNLYGPFDNFDLKSSHVLPALMRKAHEAKATNADTLSVWGSGTPLREFLHVDDLADALVFLARTYSSSDLVNIGTGDEVSIGELAHLIAGAVGFEGKPAFDTSRHAAQISRYLAAADTRLDAVGALGTGNGGRLPLVPGRKKRRRFVVPQGQRRDNDPGPAWSRALPSARSSNAAAHYAAYHPVASDQQAASGRGGTHHAGPSRG